MTVCLPSVWWDILSKGVGCRVVEGAHVAATLCPRRLGPLSQAGNCMYVTFVLILLESGNQNLQAS